MLILRVSEFQGNAPPVEHSASFGEGGGSIGRAPENTLALDDPERKVSRFHARIVCTNSIYSIVDQGSNPLLVNGRPLGQGVSATLRDGDELQIGEYSLRVEMSAMSGTPVISAEPPADPLGMFASSSGIDDPFANLLAPPPISLAPVSMPPQAQLPADFDPLVDPFAAPPQSVSPARLPDDFDLGDLAATPPGSGQIDALFGLDPVSTSDPLAGLMHSSKSGGSQPSDPMEAFGEPPRKIPEVSQPDQVPEWRAAFTPPIVREASPQTGEGSAIDDPLALFGVAMPPPIQQSPISDDPLLDKARPPDTLSIPASAVAPNPNASSLPVVEDPLALIEGDAGACVSSEALLAALIEGLAEPSLRIPGGFTPELARQLGELLSEATRGTLDLLVARALTKREVRAEVTMIVARENNPLKFSPNPAVALQHLLAPQGQGFLAPTAALRDAYDDLRAHQFGFMAGMRAALAGVLARFEPTRLEARLADKSLLDSVLPANRKAKLWDQFQTLYGELSREAEDDFHNLFGREFLRAYEEQIDRIDRERMGRS
jgi:FHA domain-containing protein